VRRAPLSEKSVDAAVSDAELIIDRLLDADFTPSVVVGARVSNTSIPQHIVDYVTAGVGLPAAAAHWRVNHKRIRGLMADHLRAASPSGARGKCDHVAIATLLASEACLRLAGEVAAKGRIEPAA